MNDNVAKKRVYLQNLNNEQYEAATHKEGPLLIIAGAGSGKTHTLISRVAYLVDQGVKPESILLLTFTNKAADEMKSRAKALTDERCGNIMACTFHSFCATMLRRYAKAAGYRPNFTILSPSEATDTVKIVKAKEEKYKKLKGFPNAKSIAAIISGAINRMMTIEEYMRDTDSKYLDFIAEVQEIATKYREYKHDRNLMDYDDLLTVFADLLEFNGAVRKIISDTYQFIMVDEYQDTNLVQEKIVLLLREDCDNLAVVGDDAQSIYKFRGAEIENILTFAQKMPGCKIVNLKTNYRSSNEIVQFSNAVINTNKRQGFEKHMRGTFASNEYPMVITPYSDSEEASVVLNMVKAYHRQGIPFHEIAVLARASSSMYKLETKLTEQGIGYDKMGGLKFLEHECVVDVLAYLKCLTNPSDSIAWFRLLRLHPGIGDTYAGRIAEDSLTNRDFLMTSKHIKKGFRDELLYLENRMQYFDSLPFKAQVEKIIDFYLKLRKRLVDTASVKDESNRTTMMNELDKDREVLASLPSIMEKYSTASEFLDAIMLDATASPRGEVEDPLILSTIHSVKGLEYQVVIVLGCVEGVFPREMDPDEDDGEELRCFYVAITRPKEHLIISCPESLMVNGQFMAGIPSRYLDGCDGLFSWS